MQVLNYIIASFASLLLVYTCMPTLWLALMTADEYNLHRARNGIVAARNYPFRETSQPANMAKLILLRQKIQSSNRKRRAQRAPAAQRSQAVRNTHPIIAIARQKAASKATWIRFGRTLGVKQYY